MKDYKSQLADATNKCCHCGQEFTPISPCCCDDGLFETAEGTLHTDGVCKACCRHDWRKHTSQHERSE